MWGEDWGKIVGYSSVGLNFLNCADGQGRGVKLGTYM